MNILTRQEVEAVVESFAKYYDDYQPYNDSCECSIKYGVCEKHKNIQCLITIGNVFDKMKEMDFFIGAEGHVGDSELLVCHWMPLGFTKSLQEIVDKSAWQLIPAKTTCKNGETNWNIEVLKSPEANALLSFLQEIL